MLRFGNQGILNFRVSSRCLHYFPAAILVYHRGTPMAFSYISVKHFAEYLKFWDTHRDKIWRRVLFIYPLVFPLDGFLFLFFFIVQPRSQGLLPSLRGKRPWVKNCKFFKYLLSLSIGHVRYINILAWLRGFRVKIANFSSFFCLSIPKRDLDTKKTTPNIQV